jgi:K(+)-stimulated pyrophosphate-energized sodium pump
MGSDIFESYCGSMIATIAIAATLSPEVITALAAGDQNKLMFLPLALASVGLVCSLIGIQIVKGSSRKSPDVALRMGTIGASVIFILAALALTHYVDVSIKIWLSVLVGALGGIVIGLVTEYYTAGKPVQKIANSGETGPATVMISGLAIGMQSVTVPVLALCAIILISSYLSGLYGVGIAAVGMLATVGITMAIDAYVRNDERVNDVLTQSAQLVEGGLQLAIQLVADHVPAIGVVERE